MRLGRITMMSIPQELGSDITSQKRIATITRNLATRNTRSITIVITTTVNIGIGIVIRITEIVATTGVKLRSAHV